MRTLLRLLQLLLIVFFVFGAPTVTILAFYIGLGDLFTGDGAVYGISDAVKILFRNIFSIYVDPNKLSTSERTVLFSFGNAIIFLVSLVAVIYSSVSVFSKLQSLYELVPYDKYKLRYDFILRNLAWLKQIKKCNGYYEKFRASAYKNLSVKKMVHYYRDAERLLIISGDYSWLFDNEWSVQVRAHVISKIPTNVKLLSYKNPYEVADTWSKFPEAKNEKKLFESIAFCVDCSEHKASIVETSTNVSYIHLYKQVRRASRSDSVCVFYGDKEAGELIRFAKSELERLHKNALRNKANLQEKTKISNDPNRFVQ